MVQNLGWATAYNVIAIPAAAGVFVHWGIGLPMSVGALAMNLSTVIVAVNAQLLRHLPLWLAKEFLNRSRMSRVS
jgi:Cu2+-exporting ATPase